MTNEQILKNHFKLVWYDEDQQDGMTEIYFCKSCNRDFDSKILALKHYREFKGKCKSLSKNTNKQILTKCIRKAYKNGWMNGTIFDDIYIEKVERDIDQNGCGGYFHFDSPLTDITELSYINILFDHSFAKAFFTHRKDSEYTRVDTGNKIHKQKGKSDSQIWKYHISELAKSKDRLKYMEQFIK